MHLAVLLPGLEVAQGPAEQPAPLHRHALSDNLGPLCAKQTFEGRAVLAALDSQAHHRQRVLLPLQHM